MTSDQITAALALLRDRAQATSVSAVARELGYSRPAISMALSGTYGGRLDRLATAALERLASHPCPHTGETLTNDQCAAIAARPVSTGSARSFRQSAACAACPHNHHRGPRDVER